MNQPFASHSDYLDSLSSPNEPIFWVMDNYYGMLLSKWGQNSAPTETDGYKKFPNNSEDPACYGHGLEEAVNQNFCFTAEDIGADAKCSSAKEPQKMNAHVNSGACCTNNDLLKF